MADLKPLPPLGFAGVLLPRATGNLDLVTAPLVLVVLPVAVGRFLAFTRPGNLETTSETTPPVLLFAGFMFLLISSIRSLVLRLRLRLRLRFSRASSSGSTTGSVGTFWSSPLGIPVTGSMNGCLK